MELESVSATQSSDTSVNRVVTLIMTNVVQVSC